MLFFNFSKEEKELDYQLQVYSSLEILYHKKNAAASSQKTTKVRKNYFGLLMPLYEFEYDLGSYGFVGTNDVKIILIKVLENTDLDVVNNILSAKLNEIHLKYSNLIINPFFDISIFSSDSPSSIRDNFINGVVGVIKKINK